MISGDFVLAVMPSDCWSDRVSRGTAERIAARRRAAAEGAEFFTANHRRSSYVRDP